MADYDKACNLCKQLKKCTVKSFNVVVLVFATCNLIFNTILTHGIRNVFHIEIKNVTNKFL